MLKHKLTKQKSLQRRLSLLLIAMMALLCTSSEQRRAPRFDQMYDCYIIVDAEVSPYEDDEDTEQVDSETLLEMVGRARYNHHGFVPVWRVQLYDDEGVRYRLYFSGNCRYFRIDGNYFHLRRPLARRVHNFIRH